MRAKRVSNKKAAQSNNIRKIRIHSKAAKRRTKNGGYPAAVPGKAKSGAYPAVVPGKAKSRSYPAVVPGKAKSRSYPAVVPGKAKSRPYSAAVPRKTLIGLAAVFGVVILAALAFWYIQSRYTVTNIYVEGNLHYSNEEIQNMIMEGPLGGNSLYLSMKYKNKEITDIPFIETMSVKILSPDTIRITVYEKALAGYVEYLGRYLYFDREGIIVESSEMKTKEIPQVTGLSFQYVVLHERLPVENEDIFDRILDMTQLLTKYGISADRIYFDKNYEMTLYFADAKVKIGKDDFIDEKIMKLQHLLPELEGKSGTLHMENYTEDTKNITFNLDIE